jgi:beta-galactosidase
LNLKNDGCDAMPVTVRVLDKKGRAVPTANLPIEFSINESGSILGVGNGDPNCHEPDKASKRSLFNGLAQVTIQSKEGVTGYITLTATSPGLKSATVSLSLKAVTPILYVDVVSPELIIDKWRISPFFKNRPDPNQQIADNDMNSWAPVKPGVLHNFNDGLYAVYRATFKPYKAQQKEGGVLVLKNVSGKAEVWIDQKLVYTKSTFVASDIRVAVPASEKMHEVNLLIEREPAKNAGLGGVVHLTSVK